MGCGECQRRGGRREVIELMGEEASDGLIDELAVAVCQWEDGN